MAQPVQLSSPPVAAFRFNLAPAAPVQLPLSLSCIPIIIAAGAAFMMAEVRPASHRRPFEPLKRSCSTIEISSYLLQDLNFVPSSFYVYIF